jgi:Asp/Glu/hydantoin racemase
VRPQRLGLLHTVPDLAGRFQRLAADLSPGCLLVHVADPDLLTAAADRGTTPELTGRVGRHVDHLIDVGVDAVLVTCSSLGDCVDEVARSRKVPVLRVDRPMAREALDLAARHGGRIAVLATLEATLEPTRRLVERESQAAGLLPTRVDARVVPNAAAARSAGDLGRHDDLVRAAVAEAVGRADVVILAQASMADAILDHEPACDVPVLASPVSGLRAALFRASPL